MSRSTITVTKGRQAHTDTGAIGGSNGFIDKDGQPTVLLAVTPNGTNGERLRLHQGDTFPLGDELWEVTEIAYPQASFWSATITRVR